MLHSKGKKLPKIRINRLELINEFSLALRKEMHQQAWTSKILAENLNVSERTVKDWLMAKRLPNSQDLLKLMRISSYVKFFVWKNSELGTEKKELEQNLFMILQLVEKSFRLI
ncbi:hypothetical protein OKT76_16420 [Providencia rettgeri]|uniref:hypothetical protein n=1 Tax=Providencia TaxID=586 RepID=UPI0021D51944|nr:MULTISPECIES: hypothetical protein [Providencia]MCX9097317.1 hypothetical protein [Providencia rettgeri]WIE09324.1 hypothetical protein N4838_005660 [Providencia rettgeri]HEM8180217.1 hypothetical protein [Providencia rettgeri]HEM8182650.1 hypothetical protein [Providencia rettgeri]